MSAETQNYLDKLLSRRFDEDKAAAAYLSKSFHEYEESGPIAKYLLESAQPIPREYAKQLFYTTTSLVKSFDQDLLHRRLKVDIRYQGAIQTNTQIFPKGEIEIMVIMRPRDKVKAYKSVEKLGTVMMGILTESGMFDKIDYSNKVNIHAQTKKEKADITVLPTIWVDTQVYLDSKREIDRGIAEYDFLNKTRRSYLPFRNIARINYKDTKVNGNLKKLIRMIRSIQVDAEEPIDLNHYEISCTLFHIRERKFELENEYLLTLLPIVSTYLDKLVRFDMFRKVISPSRKELVFGHKKEKGAELMKLKNAIDKVLSELSEELRSSGKTIESPLPY